MSATRDPDRIFRAWLEQMPDEAPDRAIAAVLQATHGASQARALPWVGIRRSPTMNRLTLIAATTLVAVALLGGAIFLTGGGPGPAVPTLAPTASATPLAIPTSPEVLAPAPQTTWGDWIADAGQIPEVSNLAQQIQLSINWDGGSTAWVQLNGEDGRLVLQSTSLAAPDRQLWLRADAISSGCSSFRGRQEGRYQWDRSTDGLFLTLRVIKDDCEARAITLARTWVRSHGAVNDGGPGVLYGMDPLMMFTMPTGQRYGLGGGDRAAELKTFGDALPFRAFVAIRNVGGFGAPCSETDTQKQDIAHTTDAFVSYMQGFPGATVTTSTTSIAGLPAVKLGVSIDPALQCRADGAQGFHPEDRADTAVWAWQPGEIQPLYIVQLDPENTLLLWYQGPKEEEQPILDSITFLDQLPTP